MQFSHIFLFDFDRFVDQPVGCGLSFLKNKTGLVTNHYQLASEFYSFLVQFFQIFSEYQNRRFFLTGESFAGLSNSSHFVSLDNIIHTNSQIHKIFF